MNQSRKEKANKFKCPACGYLKLRGQFIKIEFSDYKGLYAKVCRADQCKQFAIRGKLINL